MVKSKNIFWGIYFPESYEHKLKVIMEWFKELQKEGKIKPHSNKKPMSAGMQYVIDTLYNKLTSNETNTNTHISEDPSSNEETDSA